MTWQFKNIIAAMAVGIVAASLGTLIVLGFFVPAGLFSERNAAENQSQEFLKTSLGIKAYGKLEIFEFTDKALPSVAAIYRKKSGSGLEKFYAERDRLGYGFVLTSDGWIVTSKSAISGWDLKNMAVAVKNRLYGPPQTAVSDTWTDAVFIKIDANDLRVASFGDSGTLGLGDIVLSGRDKNNFWFSYAAALNFYDNGSPADLVLSSERFGKTIKLRDDLPDDLNGGMVVNRYGEVVGLLSKKNGDARVIPANYFKNIVSDVLKNKKITRPYLGVNYIDLSYALAKNPPAAKGAYIYGGGAVRPVISGSPAQKAGLLTGDVILKVESDEINGQNNLAELLSQYRPDAKINLHILRAGKEMDLSVTLGGK